MNDGSKGRSNGYRRLLIALLDQTRETLSGPHRGARLAALHWVYGQRERWALPFELVCELLDYDSDRWRERIAVAVRDGEIAAAPEDLERVLRRGGWAIEGSDLEVSRVGRAEFGKSLKRFGARWDAGAT